MLSNNALSLLPSYILETLADFTDEQWGDYLFTFEPLRKKISLNEQRSMAKIAMQCGEQCAESILKKYGNISPLDLANSLNIEVSISDETPGALDLNFAQFTTPNKVALYQYYFTSAAEVLGNDPMTCHINEKLITEILVAHEIFHYIEETSTPFLYTKTKQCKTKVFGRISTMSRVACLSEIAATAFAKRLLNISFSPLVLDIFLSWKHNPKSATDLYYFILSGRVEKPISNMVK